MAVPRELLKKIRKIEIFTSKLVNDQLAGQYQSVFKGRGMAFSEVRQSQAGDDVRLIDWNVSARMNEPFVKVFVEEREMTVMLVVDLSQSEQWGTVRASTARGGAGRSPERAVPGEFRRPGASPRTKTTDGWGWFLPPASLKSPARRRRAT